MNNNINNNNDNNNSNFKNDNKLYDINHSDQVTVLTTEYKNYSCCECDCSLQNCRRNSIYNFFCNNKSCYSCINSCLANNAAKRICLNIICLPITISSLTGLNRLLSLLSFTTVILLTVAGIIIFIPPLGIPCYYCNAILEKSNIELVQLRVFWLRLLCCGCCCKRFKINSSYGTNIEDEGYLSYTQSDSGLCNFDLGQVTYPSSIETLPDPSKTYIDGEGDTVIPNDRRLHNATALHAFISGYPTCFDCYDNSDSCAISTNDCCCIPGVGMTTAIPSARYSDVFMLLLCGADPNLKIKSNNLKIKKEVSPLDLIIAKINENLMANNILKESSYNNIYWWDCLQKYAIYYKNRFSSYGFDHPFDICGCFYYCYQRCIIGYLCYPMPYDVTLMTNIKCAKLLIQFGADVDINSNYYPLSNINDNDVRLNLIEFVKKINLDRNKFVREVQAENFIVLKNPTAPTDIIIPTDVEVMKR